jgi:replicative DNA helicase
MKLSQPVHRLKRKAKLASREEKIPLNQALDAVATEEGFSSWSLLASKLSRRTSAERVYAGLAPGDLLLVGARPGHGKTLLSLELAVEAMRAGNRSYFFSLEYTERDIAGRFEAIGVDRVSFNDRFEFDSSDMISAGYIVGRLASAQRGALVVVDYLQLLDQRRENPALVMQVRTLQKLARERGLVIVFISQIDRSYDPMTKPCPDLSDVRLPNPLDLMLFNKTCFINDGKVKFRAAA